MAITIKSIVRGRESQQTPPISTRELRDTEGVQHNTIQQRTEGYQDTKERPLMIGIQIPNAKTMNGHRRSTARPHDCVPKKAASGGSEEERGGVAFVVCFVAEPSRR